MKPTNVCFFLKLCLHSKIDHFLQLIFTHSVFAITFLFKHLSLSSSDGMNKNFDNGGNEAMPSMATTAVGVSIFLLTTMACLVIKSRLYPCQSHR